MEALAYYLFLGGVMKTEINIFHLQRLGGVPLFLHPFDDPDTLLKLDANTVIAGRYGREPRPESVTLLRNELYRLIELAVKNWISEKRFIPRFLISSLLFLVVYFFLSLVIRDPIPMIDELGGSLAASFFVYYLLSRRDSGSKAATAKRIALRERVDEIYFEHDSLVEEAEELLLRLEAEDTRQLAESLADAVEFSVTGEKERLDQLVSYLRRRFASRAYRKQEKALRKRKQRQSVKLNNKLDLPLFGVYRALKR